MFSSSGTRELAGGYHVVFSGSKPYCKETMVTTYTQPRGRSNSLGSEPVTSTDGPCTFRSIPVVFGGANAITGIQTEVEMKNVELFDDVLPSRVTREEKELILCEIAEQDVSPVVEKLKRTKKQKARDFMNLQKKRAKESRRKKDSLLITKRGFVRSQEDIDGIVKLVKKSEKETKLEIRSQRREEAYKRDIERSLSRAQKGEVFSFYAPDPTVDPIHNVMCHTVWTKDENREKSREVALALRQAHLAKKARKHARRQQVLHESKEAEILAQIDELALSDAFGPVTQQPIAPLIDEGYMPHEQLAACVENVSTGSSSQHGAMDFIHKPPQLHFNIDRPKLDSIAEHKCDLNTCVNCRTTPPASLHGGLSSFNTEKEKNLGLSFYSLGGVGESAHTPSYDANPVEGRPARNSEEMLHVLSKLTTDQRIRLQKIADKNAEKAKQQCDDQRKDFFCTEDIVDRWSALGICSKVLDSIQSIILYTYQLSRSTCFMDFYSCTVMYFQSIGLSELVTKSSISAVIATVLSSLFVDRPVLESKAGWVADQLKDVKNWTEVIFDSYLSKAFMTLVSIAAQAKCFTKETASKIYNYIGFPKPCTPMELCKMALDSFIKIAEVGDLICSGVSITDAIFSDDPIIAHVKKADKLIVQSDALYPGLPVDGKLSQVEFMKDALSVIVFLTKVLPKLRGDKKTKVETSLLKLQMKVNEVTVKMNGTRRKAPIGVILHGPPGIGKSNLLAFVARVHCDVMGRQFSDSFTYSRTLTSDYWEGYDPLSQPYVHYSEIGSTHENIVKSQGDKAVKELTSLIDGTAYSVDMAFAGKGTTFAQPELVLADTNCPELNLKFLVQNPAAYARRFLYLKPTVKPEFVQQIGGSLDKARAATSEDPFDLWTFTLTYKVAISNSVSKEIDLLVDGSIHDLYDVLFKRFTDHVQNEERVLAVISDALVNRKYGTQSKKPIISTVEPLGLSVDDDLDIMSLGSLDLSVNTGSVPAHIIEAYKTIEAVDKGPVAKKETSPSIMPYIKDYVSRRFAAVNLFRSADPLRVDAVAPKIVLEADELPSIYSLDYDCPDLKEIEASLDIVDAYERPSDLIVGYAQKKKYVDEHGVWDVTFEAQLYRFVYVWLCACFNYLKARWILLTVTFFMLFGGFFFLSGIFVLDFFINSDWQSIFSKVDFHSEAVSKRIPKRVWKFVYCTRPVYYSIKDWIYGYVYSIVYSNVCTTLVTGVEDQFRFSVDYMMYIFGRNHKFKPYTSYSGYQKRRDMMIVAGGVGLTLVFGAAYKTFTKKEKKPKNVIRPEAQSDFVVSDPVNHELNDIEENVLHCGGALKRAGNAGINQWNKKHPSYSSSIKSADVEGFVKRLNYNTRTAEVRNYARGKVRATCVWGYRGNLAFINKHSLWTNEDMEIWVSNSGSKNTDPNGWFRSKVTHKDIYDIGGDVALVMLSQVQFQDYSGFVCKESIYPLSAPAYIGTYKTVAHYVDERMTLTDGDETVDVDSYMTYNKPGHGKGSCGAPLLIQRTSGYEVVGIHMSGMKYGDECLAALFNYKSLKNAEDYFRKSPYMNIHSQTECSIANFADTISPKSTFNHEVYDNLIYYGKIDAPIVMQKGSKLKASFLTVDDFIQNVFLEHLEFTPTTLYGPPPMKAFKRDGEYFSPWNYACNKLNKSREPLDRDIGRKIIDVLSTKFASGVRAASKTPISWSPMTVEEAVNGAECDGMFRRINASTSGGFGWTGGKRVHIPIVKEENGRVVREPTSKLKEKILALINECREKRSGHFVYTAALKDEARDVKKNLIGKTRVFWMSSLRDLIVSRMMLSPLYSSMVENSRLYSTCVGIDMHKQAHLMYDEITKFAKNIIEGDYVNFDQVMPFDIGWIVCSVIEKVSEAMGFSVGAMDVLRGVLTSSLFPLAEMNKDVFCAPGQQPSGKYGTAEDNGLRGLVLLMYYFYWFIKNNPEQCSHLPSYDEIDFFQFVCPKTYGDDVLASVKDEVAFFMNGRDYGKFCEKHYGMGFTTASKSAENPMFVDVDKMTFLKRTFKYHSILGRIVAPLDMNSIYKSLSWYLPSDVVNEHEQMLSTLESSLRELFFHIEDQVVWTSIRDKLVKRHCEYFKIRYDLINCKVSTYQCVYNSLMEDVIDIGSDECPSRDDVSGGRHTECELEQKQGVVLESAECSILGQIINQKRFLTLQRNAIERVGSNRGATQRPQQNKLQVYTSILNEYYVLKEKIEIHARLHPLYHCELTPFEIRRSEEYVKSQSYRQLADEWIQILGEIESIDCTIKGIARIRRTLLGLEATGRNIVLESDERDIPFVIYDGQNKVASKIEAVVKSVVGAPYDVTKSEPYHLVLPSNVWSQFIASIQASSLIAVGDLSASLGSLSFYENEFKVVEKLYGIARLTHGLPVQDNLPSVVFITPQTWGAIVNAVQHSYDVIQLESLEMDISGDATTTEKHQVLLDMAGTENDFTSVGDTEPSWQLSNTSADIKRFFERPIKLVATTIPLNADFDLAFNPWRTFFEDPTVRAKLRNFAFIRGNMHIKIAVSGTKWHYGLIQVSYVPLATSNGIYTHIRPAIATIRDTLIKYLSCTPGRKSIDVKDNAPLEMMLPFVANQPMMRLFNNDPGVISSATDFIETTNLGNVELHSFTGAPPSIITSAGTGTTLGLTIYAWMSDVILGCPTATQIQIQTESDERNIGPVERFATNALPVSQAAELIPTISPFARASTMALGALRDIAAIFGWSIPNMNHEPNRVRPDGFWGEANLIGYDTGKRITLDPKQEVSIDPRVVGVHEDEMSISYLTSQPGLLDTFTWQSSDAPEGGAIWSAIVVPNAVKGQTYNGGNIYQPTPMGFAAAPFLFWRGDIEYTFEVIRSSFHQGKLAVVYEPNIAQSALLNAAYQLNKEYCVVLDLEQSSQETLCVKWTFPRAWAQIPPATDAINTINNITDLSDLFPCANGIIRVVPFTELQSPDMSSVHVNVYAHSKNMMFNEITNSRLPESLVGEIALESDEHDIKSEPTGNERSCFDLNPGRANTRNIALMHFGEIPVSFRSCCKRFFTSHAVTATVAGGVPVNVTSPVIPPLFPNTTVDAIPANLIPNLVNYLRYAYVAMTGGWRKRFRILGVDLQLMGHLKVHLLPPTTSTASFAVADGAFPPTGRQYLDGTVTFVPSVNGGIEFEVPFYTNNLFALSQAVDPFSSSLDPMTNNFALRDYKIELDNISSATTVAIYEESAPAEDFRLARFVAPPTFWLA
jgi:hypothetical protein